MPIMFARVNVCLSSSGSIPVGCCGDGRSTEIGCGFSLSSSAFSEAGSNCSSPIVSLAVARVVPAAVLLWRLSLLRLLRLLRSVHRNAHVGQVAQPALQAHPVGLALRAVHVRRVVVGAAQLTSRR